MMSRVFISERIFSMSQFHRRSLRWVIAAAFVSIPLSLHFASASVTPLGSISGVVFGDDNGSEELDGAESGVAAAPVSLIFAGADGAFGSIDDVSFPSQLSAGDGSFVFDPLAPGSYRVTVDEDALAGRLATTSNPVDLSIGLGEARSGVDFGFGLVGALSVDVSPAALSTVAGNGTRATVDGAGAAASFKDFGGIAIVGQASYVTTSGSIRRVERSSGAVSTLVGNATLELLCLDAEIAAAVQFSAISDIAAWRGALYTVNPSCAGHEIRKTMLGDGATSTVAAVAGARHLAVGPDGYVYVTSGSSIVRVDAVSGAVTTFASLGGPAYSLTSDALDLWVTVDAAGGRAIKRVRLSDGVVSTWFVSADMDLGVLESAGDFLYGAGSDGRTLRRFVKATGAWRNVAGNSVGGLVDATGPDALLSNVDAVASDGSSLWIADQGVRRLRRGVDAAGLSSAQSVTAATSLLLDPASVSTVAGDGADASVDGVGTAARVARSNGAVAVGDEVFLATPGSLRRVNRSSGAVGTLAGFATDQACVDAASPSTVRFVTPSALTTDGYYLYSIDSCSGGATVRRTSIATGMTSSIARVASAVGLTFGPDGMLYATTGSSIVRLDPSNGVQTVFASLAGTGGALSSDATDLWAVITPASGDRRIQRVSLADGSATTAATIPGLSGATLESAGSWLYAAGANGTLLLRVQKSTGAWGVAAGTGTAGRLDAAGTDAWLEGVTAVASDGDSLWLADQFRVRRAVDAAPLPSTQDPAASQTLTIDPGSVTTFVGDGTSATRDGPGFAAAFAGPTATVVDGDYVYVAQSGAIRKVHRALGVASTLIGTGAGTSCVDSLTGSAVRLGATLSATSDGHYLYWLGTCSATTRLRRTALDGGATSTLATLAGARSVTFGPDHALYVAMGDAAGAAAGEVRRVDPVTGSWSSFATVMGVASSVTSDSDALWLLASSGSTRRIDRIEIPSASVSTLVTDAALGTRALASAGGYLYASGNAEASLRRYRKSDGAVLFVAGNPTSGAVDGTATEAWFSLIRGLVSDGSNIWVADQTANTLRRVSDGDPLPSAMSSTLTSTVAIDPGAVTTFADGGSFSGGVVVVGGYGYVASNGAIRKVNLSTGVVSTLAGGAFSQFCADSSQPAQVALAYGQAITTDGTFLYSLYSCNGGPIILRTSIRTGASVTVAHPPISEATDAVFAADGFLYVSTGSLRTVLRVDPATGSSSTFATLPGRADGITSDSTALWVSTLEPTEGLSGQLSKITLASGIVSNWPLDSGLGAGNLISAGDYLYVATRSHTAIRRYAKADGSWVAVAGTNASGSVNGVGTDAWFTSIGGLASDGVATLWVVDGRLRKIVDASALPAALSPVASSTTAISVPAVVTVAGGGSSVDGSWTQAQFINMQGAVAVGTNIYAGTTGSLRRLSLATGETARIGPGSWWYYWTLDCVDSASYADVQFRQLSDVASDGHYIYGISDCQFQYPRISRTNIVSGATSTVANIAGADHLTFGPDGFLYVSTGPSHTILKLDPTTGVTSTFATITGSAHAVAADTDAIFAIINTGTTKQIQRFPLTGGAPTVLATAADLSLGVLTSAGEDLWAAGFGGTMLRRIVKSSGAMTDVAGTGQQGYADGVGNAAVFSNITGIATDGNQLWVTDAGRIRVVADLSFFTAGAAQFGWDGYGGFFDDVNAPLGNFVNEATDATITTAGPPLHVTRTYNSLDTRDGFFGKGWSSDYEMTWQPVGVGGIAILHGDGRREVHTRSGDGTFTPPKGYFSTLSQDGSGYRLTSKERIVYQFDSSKRLTSILDRNGHTLTLSYEADKLDRVTDSASGRYLQFAWNGQHVSSVATNPIAGNALTWNYFYDAFGQLDRVCDPRDNSYTGMCTRYTWTGSKISKIVKPAGNTDVELAYLPSGRVDWRADGLANRTTFTYPDTTSSIVTDARGNPTTAHYDGQYRVTKTVDPAGGETSYEYDANGNRSKITDPLGNITAMTYDVRGNVTATVDPESKTRFMTYDGANNLTIDRDPRSASSSDETYATHHTYDDAGNRLTQTSPATTAYPSGVVTQWTYTTGQETAFGGSGTMPAGLLRTSIDERGKATTNAYDAAGDLRETIDPAGLVTRNTYDQIGRLAQRTIISDTYPAGVSTDYTYDPLGHVLTETGPAVTNAVSSVIHRQKITRAYDENGNVTSEAISDLTGGDPSRVTSYHYDAMDREYSRTDAEGGVLTRVFDAAGNVTHVTDQEGRVRHTTYNSRNLPVGVVLKNFVDDPIGGSTPRDLTVEQYGYDAAGRKTSQTDALSRVHEIAYDKTGRVLSTTLRGFVNRDNTTRDIILNVKTYDAAGNTLTETSGGGKRQLVHTYDQMSRRLTSILDPNGLNRTTTYTYDQAGNPTRQTLTDGTRSEETRTTYDDAGRKISQTIENGATDLITTWTYDTRGALVETVNPRGNASGATAADYATTLTNDALGRVTSTQLPPVSIEAAGGNAATGRPTTTVGYDTFGQATHTRDPRSNTTITTYDLLGRRVRIDHPAYTPLGGTTLTPYEAWTYDHVGNLISNISRRGQTTDYTFDMLNRVVQQRDPAAISGAPRGDTRISYDDAGNTTSRTDQRGARTETSYDKLNRARIHSMIVRQPGGSTTSHTTTSDYDDLGNKTFEQDPAGNQTTWTYSGASEMLTSTDPLSKTTTYQHDVAGRTTRVTDPLGRQTRSTFDLAGRNTAQTRHKADGTLLTTTSYGYDAVGNQVSVTTPRGYSTTSSYDAANRLISVAVPIDATTTATTSYGYDAAGNQTRLTDAEGHATLSTYTPWNQQADTIEPSTITYPSAADRTFTTSYDAGGLPIQESQPGVTINRTFDNLGRLTQEAGSGSGITSASRSFGYDAAGNRTSLTHPAGTIGFTYDDRGLLTGQTGPAGTATYNYDAAGRPTTRADAAGTASFTWTNRSELQTVTDPATGATLTYARNDAGQPTSMTTSAGATRTYDYDDLGRLTDDTLRNASNAQTAQTTYGYDADSNITSKTIDLPGNASAGMNTYGYDRAGRLAFWTKPDTSIINYSYDKAGNRTQAGDATFTYNQRNQLTASPDGTHVWTPRGTIDSIGSATYTFDGLARLTNRGATTFTYDSLDRIATRNASSTFLYNATSNDPIRDDTATYTQTPAGRMLSVTQAGVSTLALLDRHTDLTALITPAGDLNATAVYDPYGVTLAATGTLPAAGYQSDYTADGEVWMGARWYAPSDATFRSRDTYNGELRTPVSLNRYTYANNNPLTYFDPDGHRAVSNDWNDRTDRQAAASTSRIAARQRYLASQGIPSNYDSWTLHKKKTFHATRQGSAFLRDHRNPGSGGTSTLRQLFTRETLRDADRAAGNAIHRIPVISQLFDATDAIRQGQFDKTITAINELNPIEQFRLAVQACGDASGRGDTTGVITNCGIATIDAALIAAGGAKIAAQRPGIGAPNTARSLNLPFRDASLRSQVDDVVRHFDEFGRPPTGVAQGGLKNYPNGTYGGQGLPKQSLGYYTESDVWLSGGGIKRGAERLVFGRGGEVYYTPTHYDDFVRIR